MRRSRPILLLVAASLLASAVAAPASAAPASPVTFTILHTNDFHGQLERSRAATSNPGSARVAAYRERRSDTRSALDNVLLVDAGDEMQGSLLSQPPAGRPDDRDLQRHGLRGRDLRQPRVRLGHRQRLAARTTEATYPYVSANIVKNDTGQLLHCRLDEGPTSPTPRTRSRWSDAPNGVRVAFHRRDDPRGADDHDRQRHRGPVLQGSCRVDPPLLRHDEGRVRRHRRAQPPGLHRRRLWLRDLGLRGPDPGREAQHGRQACQPDHRRPQPHEPRRGHRRSGPRPRLCRRCSDSRKVSRASHHVQPQTRRPSRPPGRASPSCRRVPRTRTATRSPRRPRTPRSRPWWASYASDPAYQALINTPVGYVQTGPARGTTTATG